MENKNKIIPEVVKQYINNESNNQESTYGKLEAHKQRALNQEANLQVKGYTLSNTYGEWSRDENNALLLLNSLQEIYAKNPDKIRELVIRDNKDTYNFPLEHNRQIDREVRAKAIANRLDREYNRENNLSSATIKMLHNQKSRN